MLELRQQVADNINDQLDREMAGRILDGITKAIIDPKTDKGNSKKGFINLSYAVAMFLNMFTRIQPKVDIPIPFTCEQLGDEFADHLDAFCCMQDMMNEEDE